MISAKAQVVIFFAVVFLLTWRMVLRPGLKKIFRVASDRTLKAGRVGRAMTLRRISEKL